MHEEIIGKGLLMNNISLGNALVDMYARCGVLEQAQETFDALQIWDVVSWSTLISGYAQHGLGKDALDAFHRMQKECEKPDTITFTSIFNACSRSGLVEEACHIYRSMEKDYNILPSIEHYGCMVDLFGRSALMEEAEDCIDTMPLIPNVVIWDTFVNACRAECDKKQMQLT